MRVRITIRNGSDIVEEEVEVPAKTSYDALGAAKDLVRERYAHLQVDERPSLLSVLPLPISKSARPR